MIPPRVVLIACALMLALVVIGCLAGFFIVHMPMIALALIAIVLLIALAALSFFAGYCYGFRAAGGNESGDEC